MNPSRLALDNPTFAGRLRYAPRSSSYQKRPLQQHFSKQIQDIRPSLPKATQRPLPKFMDAPTVRRVAPSDLDVSKRLQHTKVLKRALLETHRPKTQKTSKSKQAAILYVLAGVLFLIGAAVSLNGLRANHQVAAQVKQLSHIVDKNSKTTNGSAPSTTPIAAKTVASYSVAPNLPRYIDIAKLSVHARILSVGVTSSGALATPNNIYDTAWYNASAQPGQPGAMLIDGHISSWTSHGVFYGLDKLVAGDIISITRGDGQVFKYTVVKNQMVDANKVDMASMLISADPSKPGLNLISCAGDVIPGTNEFDKRIMVYAVLE